MAKEEKEEAKPSGGGILPIINMVLLVLVLAVGGFIAWTLLQMNEPEVSTDTAPVETSETKIPEAEVEDPDAPPVLMTIDNITVNLADTEVSRFLRAKIQLELRTEADAVKLGSDMGQAKINDLILTLLSSKQFDEIRTPKGKYALKEELIFRLNKTFPNKPVKKLYFTDFVSQ